MVFSSYTFIFVFLPITFLIFHFFRRFGAGRTAITFLTLASFFFYAYWRPKYVIIIGASVLGNYCCAILMLNYRRFAKPLLLIGLTANVGLLCYFKYMGFFVEQLNSLAGTSFGFASRALPLGISFFTFQTMAYLVDSYREKEAEKSLVNFSFFVVFFAQLIAGPIVHHKAIIPQIKDLFRRDSYFAANTLLGLMFFSIGLFKKSVLADPLALPVMTVFDRGMNTNWADAWLGGLAYTEQLYFDFSGYSDMAIGLGLLFGVHIPINFNSPYKSDSIQVFWRRWHMTLSAFMRDYIYIPLGGNQRTFAAGLACLFITFLIGGFWHGAAWTFILWGAFHGAGIALHRIWRERNLSMPRFPAFALTFIFVVFGWVVFRAKSLQIAGEIWGSMIGSNGFTIQPAFVSNEYTIRIGLGLLIVWILPNPSQYLEKITWVKVVACATLMCVALIHVKGNAPFLYFDF